MSNAYIYHALILSHIILIKNLGGENGNYIPFINEKPELRETNLSMVTQLEMLRTQIENWPMKM